jgi:hypothetical protein
VYSIDELDRGTPTHVGIGQDCLLGNHGFLVAES